MQRRHMQCSLLTLCDPFLLYDQSAFLTSLIVLSGAGGCAQSLSHLVLLPISCSYVCVHALHNHLALQPFRHLHSVFGTHGNMCGCGCMFCLAGEVFGSRGLEDML